MKKAIITVCIAPLFLFACASAGKTTHSSGTHTQGTQGSAQKPPQTGSSSNTASTASTTAPASAAQQQTVTVNDPAFMRDVWGNVKDISAANRNFAGTSTTAVAGVRAKASDLPDEQPEKIPRADLERSVAELRKILAEPDLSAVERSCYAYYMGSCLIKLGQTKEGRSRLEDAKKADPNGKYARLAAEELARR
jgi:hypothetical protein